MKVPNSEILVVHASSIALVPVTDGAKLQPPRAF